MKRLLTAAAAALTILCSAAGPARAQHCRQASYEPDVISHYGNSATIIKKLDNDRMGLTSRRAYVLLVETKKSAELAFFERDDPKNVKVYQWSGASMGNLREQLTEAILENRGIACIGEQTKSMVKASFDLDDRGAIPQPLTARAAFSHMLKKYDANQYLRVTILLLC